ncbi:MAG: response regulator [Nitrospira sp.]|nr:response regulator [Nitrospira sp.]
MGVIENPRILLIEDNPDHAEIVMRHIKMLECPSSITHLHDGEEAIHFFQRLESNASSIVSNLPSVVLLDLRLPRIDGLEILKAIKANQKFKNLPVIILSTSKAESDVTRALELGADDYLVKPFNQSMLLEIFNRFFFKGKAAEDGCKQR